MCTISMLPIVLFWLLLLSVLYNSWKYNIFGYVKYISQRFRWYNDSPHYTCCLVTSTEIQHNIILATRKWWGDFCIVHLQDNSVTIHDSIRLLDYNLTASLSSMKKNHSTIQIHFEQRKIMFWTRPRITASPILLFHSLLCFICSRVPCQHGCRMKSD